MAKVHDRILQITFIADESADTAQAGALVYYRTRADYDAGSGFTVNSTAGAESANHEIALGEVFPPPSVIVLTPTFQA